MQIKLTRRTLFLLNWIYYVDFDKNKKKWQLYEKFYENIVLKDPV